MPQKSLKKILVVNPYGIGDVLFTTPLLADLRDNFPKSYIAVLLGSRTKEILENNPDIDEIFVFDKGKFDKLPRIKALNMLFKLLKKIRERRFNLLIDLSNSSQYGFIEKFFLNIPRRIGFNYRNRGRFLTERIELKGYKDKHIVEYYLDLARLLKIEPKDKKLKFPVKEKDKTWAEEFLKSNNIASADMLIGIMPAGGLSWGQNAKYKHWNRKKFAELSDKLIERYKAKIIILASKEEEYICEYVLNCMKHKALSVCGKTSICQFAALCSLCNFVICNDGGPLHVAVSQGTPTISIFGPVDDKVYGPYPESKKNYIVKKDLSCRPCYQNFKFNPCSNRRCLNAISVDDVLEKVKSLKIV